MYSDILFSINSNCSLQRPDNWYCNSILVINSHFMIMNMVTVHKDYMVGERVQKAAQNSCLSSIPVSRQRLLMTLGLEIIHEKPESVQNT